MPNRDHERKLTVCWSTVEDPYALELLCEAVRLILNDPDDALVADEIDNQPQPELNDRTPVESNNSQTPSQPWKQVQSGSK